MNIPPKYEDLVFQLNELNKREAALRESLADKREEYNKLGDRYDALQQSLTVAEQGLKTIIKRCQAGWSTEAIELEAEEALEDIALNPAEGEWS